MFYIFDDLSERNFDDVSSLEKYCRENKCYAIHQYSSRTPKIQYLYKFSDGSKLKLNVIQARIYAKTTGSTIISGGPIHFPKKDIYSGFNPGLGIDVRGRTHYRDELKKRGLEELGDHKPIQSQPKPEYLSDDACRDISSMSGIGDRAIDAIRSGEKLHSES